MKFRSLILIAALAGGSAAYAQAPDGGQPSPEFQAARAAMRKACAADIATLCSGLTGREANQCLRQNSDKVSADCKDAMSKLPHRTAPPAG